MKLDRNQRKELSKIFLNLCQAIFIALIIGRIATPGKITVLAFIFGLIFFIVFLVFGILLSKKEE